MKKRTKKYNPKARAIALSKAFAKKYAVVWAGTLEAQIVKLSALKPVLLKQSEALAISNVPHKWQVHLCCMLRDHTGRDYIQVQELRFSHEYLSCDTSEIVNDHMKSFVKTCNSNHVVNVGWVATTSEEDLSDEKISKMMDNIGAWDFLAKHEVTDSTEVLALEKQG